MEKLFILNEKICGSITLTNNKNPNIIVTITKYDNIAYLKKIICIFFKEQLNKIILVNNIDIYDPIDDIILEDDYNIYNNQKSYKICGYKQPLIIDLEYRIKYII